MRAYAHVAYRVAAICAIKRPSVRFANDPAWPFAATYGRRQFDIHVEVDGKRMSVIDANIGGQLTINAGALGAEFFDAVGPDAEAKRLELLIHEFGHEYASDHLSSGYHEALCRIGARLAVCGRELAQVDSIPEALRGGL